MIAVFAAVVMHWLVLNDIHMNPYDRSQHAPYARDTNPWLFDSAVAEMKREVPNPAVIVLGGDLLAHHFASLARGAHRDPYAAGEETVAAIATTLDRAFPHAQFLIAVGNNDDPCGDYRSETGGAYATATAKIFAPLVNRDGSAPSFVRDYTRGAYYAVELQGGTRAIVLNDVIWSFVYRGSCLSKSADPGEAQMRWTQSQLARGHNVVVMHMPLGFDPQSTTTAHRIVAVPFLATADDKRLRSLFQQDRSHIGFAIAGHTHRYDFRVPGGVPMLDASSLSPVYRNSPAFFRLDVEGDRLRDVVPYTYDAFAQSWVRQDSFDTMYGTQSFDARELLQLHRRIVDDPSVRVQWIQAYDVWGYRVGDISDHRWQTFACAQVAFGAEFGACAGTTKRSVTLIAGAIAAAAAVIVAIVLLLRLRARRLS